VLSGGGLAIDTLLFIALLPQLGPFLANLISAALAVTFVYFASVRRIFEYQGKFMLALFLLYLAYQAVGVTASSAAVAWLSTIVPPVPAKIIIIPVTFAMNFLFMTWLTRRAGNRPVNAAGAR
jgi:putative flippase GtrA